MDTMTRYLRLCDVPVPPDTGGALADLFTEDAVWEGAGQDYATKFGRTEGREAIVGMLSAYLPPDPHFQTNVHLLLPGTIDIADSTAHGNWLMQQLSRYESGTEEIMVARLDVTFRLGPEEALISRFRTQRLFSAPLGGKGER